MNFQEKFEQLIAYFERFGEVESSIFHSKYAGDIQYKNADSAKAVLLQKVHSIDECFAEKHSLSKVKAANAWEQPDYNPDPLHPLVNSPAQDCSRHILNALNDDCLRRVFSYLPLMCLADAAEVCVRFNTIAKEVFSLMFKNLIITNDRKSHIEYLELTKVSAEKLLRNFGSLMASIEVEFCLLLPTITCFTFLELLGKYCNSTLRKLSLNGFPLNQNRAKCMNLLFVNLNELRLIHCKMIGSKLLSKCQKLKTFHMEECDEDALVHLRCAELEEVQIISRLDYIRGSIISFFKSNATIRKLSLLYKCNSMVPVQIIDTIGERLLNLQHLEHQSIVGEFYFFHLDEYTKHFGRLSSLRVLDIVLGFYTADSCTQLLRNLVENGIPIRHLSIKNAYIEKATIEQLVQLKEITVLKMLHTKKLKDEHLVEIIQKMPQLQEIYFDLGKLDEITTNGLKKMLQFANNLSELKVITENEKISIDVHDYKTILESVQKRAKKQKLRIVIETEEDSLVSVPDEILQEGSNWLCIIQNHVQKIIPVKRFQMANHWF